MLQRNEPLFLFDNCSAEKRKEHPPLPFAVKIIGGRQEPFKHRGHIQSRGDIDAEDVHALKLGPPAVRRNRLRAAARFVRQ